MLHSTPQDTSTRESIAERLAASLRRQILQGDFAVGTRLPPERSLALQLGANRHTIREALRLLEAQKLVSTRQGSGVTVLDFRSHGSIELVPYFFEAVGFGPSLLPEIEDFFTLRRLFVVEAVGTAATAATPAQRAEIQAIAAKILAQRDDNATVFDLDFLLYETIVEASGRLLYRWMLNSFAERIQPLVASLAHLWKRPDSYFASLSQLASQLAAGDVQAARSAADSHFAENDQHVLNSLRRLLDTMQSNDTPDTTQPDQMRHE